MLCRLLCFSPEVENGWSNIDMDSITNAAISVTISTKENFTNVDGLFNIHDMVIPPLSSVFQNLENIRTKS